MSNNLTSSRYLGELMGAPMAAIVQAEALAAQATAEFIKGVGFESAPSGGNGDQLGNLRMVSFSYSKMDADGSIKSFDIKLPLLAIVPIPAIQVKEAQLDFTVQITGTEAVGTKEAVTRSLTPLPISSKNTMLMVDPLRIKGIIGKRPDTGTTQNKASFTMDVKITLEQSDMPMGLQQLFRIMERSITEVETPKPPQ